MFDHLIAAPDGGTSGWRLHRYYGLPPNEGELVVRTQRFAPTAAKRQLKNVFVRSGDSKSKPITRQWK
jgi:hypothetical protein